MYRVTYGESTLFENGDEDFTLTEAKLTMEINKAGTFGFTIHPTHPTYSQIKLSDKVITIWDDDTRLWDGIVDSIDKSFNGMMRVTAVGVLSLLSRAIAFTYTTTSDANTYVTRLLNSYNNNIQEGRPIDVGRRVHVNACTIDIPNSSECETIGSGKNNSVWSEISDILDEFGGYISARQGMYYGENGIIVDWVQELPSDVRLQRIKLGYNLMDVVTSEDMSNVYTSVWPVADDDSNMSVGMIHNNAAVSKYGVISTQKKFKKVKKASSLRTLAQRWVNRQSTLTNIDIRAIDMSFVEEVPRLRLGDRIKVEFRDETIETNICKMQLDLLSLSNNVITVGITKATLTGKIISNE